MKRRLGAKLFEFWLHLRHRRACEDDRCEELRTRWDATMRRFLG